MNAGTRRTLSRALAVGLGIVALLAGTACSSARPDRDPTGEAFPAVDGRSLADEPVALPADLAGRPAVLLIG